jgi:hypothetical protein
MDSKIYDELDELLAYKAKQMTVSFPIALDGGNSDRAEVFLLASKFFRDGSFFSIKNLKPHTKLDRVRLWSLLNELSTQKVLAPDGEAYSIFTKVKVKGKREVSYALNHAFTFDTHIKIAMGIFKNQLYLRDNVYYIGENELKGDY